MTRLVLGIVLVLEGCSGIVSPMIDGGEVSAGGGAATGGGGGAATGGGAQTACGPQTCGGCCSASGVCEGGTAAQLCGSAGAACTACGGSQVCGAGSCRDPQQQNQPAPLGDPSTTAFNGILAIKDTFTEPAGATVVAPTSLPAALVDATPSLSEVKVLRLRDAIIVVVPNVAGAADYRAYVAGSNVTYSTSARGPQPRNAVIACAGFRQHPWPSTPVNGKPTRALMQLIELPGLPENATSTVVVEAIASPCPWTGMPAHTDADITMDNDGMVNSYYLADPNAYGYSGIPTIALRSFATMTTAYGNVVLNGQGASIDWATRATSHFIGKPVSPTDAAIPADPQVIARSAYEVFMPARSTLPVVDVGPHALVEDFPDDFASTPASYGRNQDYASYNGFAFNPKFQAGNWQFWSRFQQASDTGALWSASANTGTQVFARLGRMFTSFGDFGQDVGGTLGFSSQVAPVLQLDAQTYVHSAFRVNVESTHRRYWWWVMCGGATPGELYDSMTKEYRLRPLMFETSFRPGGNNPSLPDGHTLESASTADDAVGVAKECLSFTELARPEDGTSMSKQTSATLRAQIHPVNKSHGIISLGHDLTDTEVLGGDSNLGFRYRVGANGQRLGSTLPADEQVSPLTKFDVYVRTDRVVLFVDGQQVACVDLTARPLTMSYAMITYGDLLYHSSIEWQEVSNSQVSAEPQMYQTLLNEPIGQTRTWDFISHADGVALPPGFDATTCRAPSDLSVKAN